MFRFQNSASLLHHKLLLPASFLRAYRRGDKLKLKSRTSCSDQLVRAPTSFKTLDTTHQHTYERVTMVQFLLNSRLNAPKTAKSSATRGAVNPVFLTFALPLPAGVYLLPLCSLCCLETPALCENKKPVHVIQHSLNPTKQSNPTPPQTSD